MDHEQEIGNLFRDYMGQELAQPEIERAKRALIRDHFSREPFVLAPWAWGVPAAALVVLCLALYPVIGSYLRPSPQSVVPIVTEKASSAEISEAAGAVAEIPAETVTETQEMLPPVVVTSVESDLAQVMVFKQNYTDNPITIIWIFPGG